MNTQNAKKLLISEYLKALGVSPSKTTGKSLWYLSPIRNEKTPSFCVNTKKNVWYDFGNQKGGNIIDLVIAMKQCNVSSALKELSAIHSSFSFNQQQDLIEKADETIHILKLKKLENQALLEYLASRCISIKTARRFCKEVYYSIGGKRYFSIAFPNRAGGFELRNKYAKTAVSPKDISLQTTGQRTACITEGFIDFLSLVELVPSVLESADLIILNSVSNTTKAIEKLTYYDRVLLFLDNDASGIESIEKIKDVTKGRAISMADLYQPYKDLNEFLCANKTVSAIDRTNDFRKINKRIAAACLSTHSANAHPRPHPHNV
ncbi:MAG: Conjugative transposon proteinTraP [Bacteroidota bacterium]|jgi:5S rRNA maturation endonuclease (ribonuclease M5)